MRFRMPPHGLGLCYYFGQNFSNIIVVLLQRTQAFSKSVGLWQQYFVAQRPESSPTFLVVNPYGKQCCLSALELFCCLPPLFCCLPCIKTVRLHGKKLQNATNVSSVLTIASKKAILLSTLFDHFYLLNMRHQELVSEFIKTCTRQYVPASLRQHLATQYPEFVRNLCRLRRVVLLVARKKTDVDQSPQFFRNLSCVITLN